MRETKEYDSNVIKKKTSNNNFDIVIVIMSLIIGIFIGYLLGTNLDNKTSQTTETGGEIETLNYIYLLQVARFDNPTGASNYIQTLKSKNLDSICVYDKVYYYIYGGISSKQEDLDNLKNKFYIMGYETIIKKELLEEKANMIIDDTRLYNYYLECINNLYLSLKNEPFTISEIYYIDPINIELFTQLSILTNMKNQELRLKAQLQAYKLIIESI